jgi:hypothetical protein
MLMTVLKTRIIPGKTLYNIRFGSIDYSRVKGGGTESCEGVNHNLRDLGRRDCGGPAQIMKEYRTYNPVKLTSAYNYSWAGTDVYPSEFPIGGTPGPTLLDSLDALRAMGTTAIARSMPTNPSFDMGVALGEVRSDGIPSVVGVQTWQSRSKGTRNAGNEYLNYEFGWVPLVNDIRRFCHTVSHSASILRQFRKESDKNIRVSYHFPAESSTWSGTGNYILCSPDGSSSGFKSVLHALSSSENKTWFKGCFTYHIPIGEGLYQSAMRFGSYADHLLGVRLDPETLWNLAPWSWALDWFSNTGDIIHNLVNLGSDGLVLKYGYLMQRREYHYSIVSGTTDDALLIPSGSSYLQDSTYFIRIPAQPYFGFATSGELTPSQIAILAALGLSRGP